MDTRLEQACGAFEQTVIATLVAPVARAITAASDGVDNPFVGGSAIDGDSADTQLAATLFPEIFAQALEHAGGLGLRAELARALAHEP